MSINKNTPRDPQADREARHYDNPIASRELLLELLEKHGAPLTYDGFVEILKLTGEEPLEALRRRLIAMVRDGQLIKNRRGGHVLVNDEDLVRGRVIAHPDSFGFLVPDEGGDDLFLGPKEMRLLLHGDRAVVRVAGFDRRGRREGVVVEVLERANHQVVGRFYNEDGLSLVIADNKRIHQEVFIPSDQRGAALHGQIVMATIVQQPNRRHQPIGHITEVLGDHMMPGMEIQVALNAHNIPVKWPQAVEEQIVGLSPEVQESDKGGREDLRHLPLVTIDGADSQDFDDAVFCEKQGSNWRLLVAIADVSHYVQIGTPLDDEAQLRATSVYFPGRVVPMLPEVLSNGLCSLNPHVDRLCMVAEMIINPQGKMIRSRFFEGLMCSHARLTYTDVAAMLVDKDQTLRQQNQVLIPHLERLYDLYHALLARRQERGAIDFDSRETQIRFNADKKIEAIVPVGRNDAHRLIEECMILANVAAAEYLQTKKVPGLFRVHGGPKKAKLEDLHTFLKEHGLRLAGGDSPTAEDYAEVLRTVADRPDARLFQTVLLRSLSQAVYSPDGSVGHFGLSLEKYAHFTSPIRRYPDLLVHRALRHIIHGGDQRKLASLPKKALLALKGKRVRAYDYSADQMVRLGEQCSMAERRADDATRDATDWLKCEYMLDRVGEEFPGIITTVTSFGLFVELNDVYVEGLVHVTSLSKDYYKFDPKGHRMVGERSGKIYRIGDTIKVKVTRVSLDDRKIDFEPVADDSAVAAKSEKADFERSARRPRRRKRAPRKPSGGS